MAQWLNSIGITAFVLLHRLPTSPDLVEPDKAPLQDAQRAVRYVRAHASEFGVEKIGVMGCSAGGHNSYGAENDESASSSLIPNLSNRNEQFLDDKRNTEGYE